MKNNTKNLILNYISDLTENFDFTQIKHFVASSISDEMHISRSLASQYLNELVKEKLVMKINSRPVYFLHRKKMEEIYKMSFQTDDFYDLEEVKQYIKNHSDGEGNYSNIVGSDKSLTEVIKQLRESFEYPPSGLPTIIFGEKGTGKRTLCKTIFENAARKGIINENTKLVKLEFSPTNSMELFTHIFDENTLDVKGNNTHIVFMFCGIQYMSEEFQEKLSQMIDKGKYTSLRKGQYKNKVIRYMLVSDVNPQIFMNERLLKNIPVILNMPTLQDKSKEEKEELIIHFIQNEGKKVQKKLKISNAVLRALVNGDYENNLIGLQSTIKIMCASALRKCTGKSEVIIHTYDTPEHLLTTMPIATDEELLYIDTTTYQRSEEIDFILDYFNRIYKPFIKRNTMKEALHESKQNFDLLSDYLSYKRRIPPERIKGIEISLSNIFDVVLKKRYINLPSGFGCTLAKLIYVNGLFSASIKQWSHEQRFIIGDVLKQLNNDYINESMIVEEITRLIKTNLEMELSDIISIMMIVYLHHYNSNMSRRNCFGMIVCHGYSTATSIAEAANSLLENYVFDAIDMPLDVTVDEIKELLLERINRLHSNADVIVMVDMGSLEQLGNSLSTAINCNVGVINNVSTRLALNVGNCIINDTNIQMTLEKVSSKSKAAYTIVNRKKKDIILFTSESGIHMAQRMRELFENSFPKQISIDLDVCDFNQLITNGENHEVFINNNVLFITGTANPNIDTQVFVALEEIISGSNIDSIMSRLSKHLTLEQLDQLLDNLRKSFTLQNVVKYLTILNPQVLLDNVTLAVDQLQERLNQRFTAMTLVGIYIHVCCLIERLVTKLPITEFADLEEFSTGNTDFIQCVHEAFSQLTKRYNVTIPISEVAYLYDFIIADKERIKDKNIVSNL
ncbi:MAG: PRD domain-containing protein [Coprobacillaceae bacterium]